MNFELKTLNLSATLSEKCDALVILVDATFAAGADSLSPVIAQALKRGDLEAKPGKLIQLYAVPGVASPRIVVAFLGDGTSYQARQAVCAAVSTLKGAKNVKKLVIFVAPGLTGSAVAATVLAAADASYVFTTTKSRPEGRSISAMTLVLPVNDDVRSDFDQAVATVRGVELAKEWGNRPANHATPTLLAKAAQALAKQARVKCEVLSLKQVAKLGMGSFMAVAQGSGEELKFIVLRYNGAPAGQAPVVLVGKGITFDTGGISIKPAAEMDEMKFDMCGAASVLGVFRALGELQPACNVVGLIPSCENMPGSRALKPGDVVTSMSGQTIEVLNTDAEGRLILCDALTYAERFKPLAVIDIATLTGACVVALGAVRSGLFSSHDGLAAQLHAAGESSLDLCWRMPLDDEYADGLKSNFADVANLAGRAGGAITAAKFLQRFAGKFPWAHLDIAGTAWKSGAAKGATGRPVALLLNYVLAAKIPAVPDAYVDANLANSKPGGKSARKPATKNRPKLVHPN
jgi:leucyl aminopeptidase